MYNVGSNTSIAVFCTRNGTKRIKISLRRIIYFSKLKWVFMFTTWTFCRYVLLLPLDARLFFFIIKWLDILTLFSTNYSQNTESKKKECTFDEHVLSQRAHHITVPIASFMYLIWTATLKRGRRKENRPNWQATGRWKADAAY